MTSLRSSLGFFDPESLSISVESDPRSDRDDYVLHAAMAALLHERTHWLQFVGTPVGLSTVYLGAIQTSVVFNNFLSEARSAGVRAEAFPLLDSGALTDGARAAWLGVEHLQLAVLGGPATLEEAFKGVSVQAEGTSQLARSLADQVLHHSTVYKTIQDHSWQEGIFATPSKLIAVGDRCTLVGASQLMETSGRVNELIRLALGQRRMVWDAYFGPPYSHARDMFYAITKTDTSAGLDFALCILADWALALPLPPTLPLITPLDTVDSFPGSLFGFLASRLDTSAIPEAIDLHTPEWADEQAQAIYAQISSASGLWTPLDIARDMRAMYGCMEEVDLMTDLYSPPVDPAGLPTAKDGVGRPRFMTKRAYDAAGLRLRHPAFFACPALVYARNRDEFHEYFDVLRPPLWSTGYGKWIPTADDQGWFLYFLGGAIQHDIATLSVLYGCGELAAKLAARYPYILEAGIDGKRFAAEFVELNLFAVLGDGSAAAAIVDQYNRLSGDG